MYCRAGTGPYAPTYRDVHCRSLLTINTKQASTLSHGLVAAVAARFAAHDVILSVNIANALFCALLRATGQRVVLNTDGQEWLRGKWGVVAKAFFRGSAKASYWSTTALISDCIAMRSIYQSEFGAASTVIPYCWTGIGGDASSRILDDLGLRQDGYSLIAGRLVPENRIAEVVEQYLAASNAPPILVLGAANYESPVVAALSRLADGDPRVRLGGHVANRESYAMLVRGARVYLHSHVVGGINPSLLEAMGCGARILARRTAFNVEALGETGSYFTEDPGSLRKAIDSLLKEDAVVGRATRDAAICRANDRFSLGAVADAYEALLSEVSRAPRWSRVVMGTLWDRMAEGD